MLVEKKLNDASQHYILKEYNKAIIIYEELLKEYRFSFYLQYHLANCYSYIGNFSTAFFLLSTIKRLIPKNELRHIGVILIAMAENEKRRGEKSRSEKYYKEAEKAISNDIYSSDLRLKCIERNSKKIILLRCIK